MNDEKPELFYTEFVVDEGGLLTIDLPRLSADDYDIPEDELTFTIITPPENGGFFRTVSQVVACLLGNYSENCKIIEISRISISWPNVFHQFTCRFQLSWFVIMNWT